MSDGCLGSYGSPSEQCIAVRRVYMEALLRPTGHMGYSNSTTLVQYDVRVDKTKCSYAVRPCGVQCATGYRLYRPYPLSRAFRCERCRSSNFLSVGSRVWRRPPLETTVFSSTSTGVSAAYRSRRRQQNPNNCELLYFYDYFHPLPKP